MAPPAAPAAVLLVDDEPNLLEALRRQLRRAFQVEIGVGGAQGVVMLRRSGPFAAVVSDLRMPGMDGVAFLGRAREMCPDTVRCLLTGHADLGAAIAVVNQGQVFRFLTKPCPPDVLLPAIAAAVEQHRLIHAERELLEQTLHGAVKVLTDLLALASPAAFGRATRLKGLVAALAERAGVPARWQAEVAAMVSQVAAVTLPPATADKLHGGQPLSGEEAAMVERLPAVAAGLLGSIPRLEGVRDILLNQARRYDGAGNPPGPRGEQIPWGARALRLALDFDALEAAGEGAQEALATLRGRRGAYDEKLLQALVDTRGEAEAKASVVELKLADLEPGMVLDEDLKTGVGVLLVARGQEVTPGLLERLRNFARTGGLDRPIRVRVAGERPVAV